jgi:hypothetical protein
MAMMAASLPYVGRANTCGDDGLMESNVSLEGE